LLVPGVSNIFPRCGINEYAGTVNNGNPLIWPCDHKLTDKLLDSLQ